MRIVCAGNSILVHPVTAADVSSVTVYFPGKNEIWYDKDTYEEVKTNGPKTISVTADRVRI